MDANQAIHVFKQIPIGKERKKKPERTVTTMTKGNIL